VTDDARLEQSIEGHEGFEPLPYLDTEKRWSAGEGLCLETRPLTGGEWKYLLDNRLITFSIAKQGADWLVRRDMAAIEQQLAHDYQDFWAFLNAPRQNALVEWAFQLGVGKEEAFHVAIAAIREARWSDAEAAMLDSLWAKRQTPARATKLAAEIGTGEFQ
jgi:GH24 family phage-related lysozyme (muramidase)